MDNDVVDLILSDHRELERLFDELQNQPGKRAGLLPVMLTLLTAHSRAEEAGPYPAAKAAGIEHDVEHSQKEHLEADQLALQLSETAPDAPEFEERLQALVHAITHHVQEEEEKVLPGIRANIDEAERARLGADFLAVREEHLGAMPADITREELLRQASNAGVDGVSAEDKQSLKETLAQNAEE